MKFVLCSDSTYTELYEKDSYKYLRLEDHTNLAGYGKIWVNIHPCWMEDYNDDRIHYLEQQLTALADFGYIRIAYVEEDGIEFPYRSPLEAQQYVTEKTSQRTLYPSTAKQEVLSESDRERLIEQEDGCGSGGCII